MRRIVALAFLIGLALLPAGGAQSATPPPLGVLLARHVPILVLHPAERFEPVRVDGFLADSDVRRQGAGGVGDDPARLPAAGLRLDHALVTGDRGPRGRTMLRGCRGSVHGVRTGRLRQGVPDDPGSTSSTGSGTRTTTTARRSRRAPSGRCTRGLGSRCPSSSTGVAGRRRRGSRDTARARAGRGRGPSKREPVHSSTSVSAHTRTTSGGARSATVRLLAARAARRRPGARARRSHRTGRSVRADRPRLGAQGRRGCASRERGARPATSTSRTTTRSRIGGPRGPAFQDTWRGRSRKSSAGRAARPLRGPEVLEVLGVVLRTAGH